MMNLNIYFRHGLEALRFLKSESEVVEVVLLTLQMESDCLNELLILN